MCVSETLIARSRRPASAPFDKLRGDRPELDGMYNRLFSNRLVSKYKF